MSFLQSYCLRPPRCNARPFLLVDRRARTAEDVRLLTSLLSDLRQAQE
jgi:hypothetical protein